MKLSIKGLRKLILETIDEDTGVATAPSGGFGEYLSWVDDCIDEIYSVGVVRMTEEDYEGFMDILLHAEEDDMMHLAGLHHQIHGEFKGGYVEVTMR